MNQNQEQKKQDFWVRIKDFMKKNLIFFYIVLNLIFISIFFVKFHFNDFIDSKVLYLLTPVPIFLSFGYYIFCLLEEKIDFSSLGDWILKNRKKSLFLSGCCSILFLIVVLALPSIFQSHNLLSGLSFIVFLVFITILYKTEKIIFTPLLAPLYCLFLFLISEIQIQEKNKVLEYFLIAIVGLPVFFLLWFFRTHDTRESIKKAEESIKKAEESIKKTEESTKKAEENIKQNKLFNCFENLASSEVMKIDLGVTQLITFSEQNSPFNEQIKLAFIKRLSYPPPVANQTNQNEAILSYGQEIIKWLVEREYEDLPFIKLNLDYQIFDNSYIGYEDKGVSTTCLKEFLDRVQKYNRNHKNKREIEIQISLKRAYLRNVLLQNADLRRANLEGADLREVKLLGANLEGADLREVKLLGANLEGADLREVKLLGANLERANLKRANLEGADLREVKLCRFKKSKFRRSRFIRSKFIRSNL